MWVESLKITIVNKSQDVQDIVSKSSTLYISLYHFNTRQTSQNPDKKISDFKAESIMIAKIITNQHTDSTT